MTDQWAEKKRIETYMLNAAREAGVPIPIGEIPGERPDYRFQTETGTLGIEVSELLRPASSNDGILPVAEEAYHMEIMAIGQRAYYALPDAQPVHVNVYFEKSRGTKRDKKQMAESLAAFVRANVHRANPAVTFMDRHAPDGFSAITMIAEHNRSEWWSGESGGTSLSDIRPQLAARISSKCKLVPAYRSNLPTGAQVWLLLYSGVTVARSMPIPYGIQEWAFPFQFDRVFWFASLEGDFVEIQRAGAN